VAPAISRWRGVPVVSGWPPPALDVADDLKGQALGAGFTVLALAESNDELVVGGDFVTIAGQISPYFARYGPAIPRGDMNFDQSVTLDDLPLFVAALLDPATLSTCQSFAANVNADVHPDGTAKIDALDVPAFVNCLLAGCP